MGKAFTWRFGFDDVRTSQLLKQFVKGKATVDATGYVFIYPDAIPVLLERWQSVWYFGYIYAYRRGVCVARFDKLGNAKAFTS